MFGLTFLFSAALFALPLAGLPVVLHLLFRRKSPVVLFPTLRFIKSSVQRTAARKRVHRWLLLACRMLLLALLIWAIAQPAKILSAGWFGGGSTVAAVVIDTSYSMQYQPPEGTLLSRAGATVQDLLRDELKDARVAIFRSQKAPADQPEQLLPATQVLAEWTEPTPQPAAAPLVDRIAAAREMLSKQTADQKWLIVLTDGQAREFPHPTGEADNLRTVWFDLHPDVVRSAGITKVAIEPRSVLAGLNATVPVTIAGRSGDAYAVTLNVTKPTGEPIAQLSPAMANLDTAGLATVRFPYRLPAERWIVLDAAIPQGDEMPWDNRRPKLIELPPRQRVALLPSQQPLQAEKFIKLALDPSEGRLAGWPVELRPGTPGAPIPADTNCVVTALSAWPDLATATRLRDLARSGGTVVLFVQPGIEDSYAKVDAPTQAVLRDLLPSDPIAASRSSVPLRATITGETQSDPLMDGLTDEKFQIGAIVVRRYVPFSSSDQATSALLRLARDAAGTTDSPTTAPASPSTGRGLLFRRTVGTGAVYTIATLPDSQYSNLATHPIFLPLLVRMALHGGAASTYTNVDLGQPLTLPGSYAPDANELQLLTPSKAAYSVPVTRDDAGRRFIFTQAAEPGLYAWHRPSQSDALAWTNVELPAAEADLKYRDAAAVAPRNPDETGTLTPSTNVVIVKSLAELQGKMAALSQPKPKWTTPIAIVLLLLCAEAFLGSVTRVTKAINWRAFVPMMSSPTNPS